MDAHLDSHFRQNRRMKERVKRGLSRSWFVTEDEWISGAGGELASHQGKPPFSFFTCLEMPYQTHINVYVAPTFLTDSTSGSGSAHQHGNVGGSPSAQAGSETIGPDSQMVVMPDENNRKPCPICGERFVDFWNDDEEEWMYKNAVLVDNTVSKNGIVHPFVCLDGCIGGGEAKRQRERMCVCACVRAYGCMSLCMCSCIFMLIPPFSVHFPYYRYIMLHVMPMLSRVVRSCPIMVMMMVQYRML